MKSINFLLALALMTTISFAQTPQEISTQTMIKMESGLANIQKGFLYNNLDLIKYGSKEISTANEKYHDRNIIKAMLPEGKQQMENAAMITSSRIDNAISELKMHIETKDMRKAHNSFSRIAEACTDCHTIIRGW